jgi:hypothetical protein
MSSRKALGLWLEALETKALMSAGASNRPATVIVGEHERSTPRLSSQNRTTDPASTQLKTIALGGLIQGSYASRQNVTDNGTRFHLSAQGTITPIGLAVVIGSFHTPGFVDGVANGSLTMITPEGSLHLHLRGQRPVAQGIAGRKVDVVNPGGPLLPPPPETTAPTIADPVLLVTTFRYEIAGGTGKYSHDRGTGTVQIATDVGLFPPGINPLSIPTESGSATVSFAPAREALR